MIKWLHSSRKDPCEFSQMLPGCSRAILDIPQEETILIYATSISLREETEKYLLAAVPLY